MEVVEVTEKYESPPKIHITIRQKIDDRYPRKRFTYKVYTGRPKIEFESVEPFNEEGESAWSAEEVEALEEMKQTADKIAERRFHNENQRELFGI